MRTSIRKAFAGALAPFELYDSTRVEGALKFLGQENMDALICAYCGDQAQTWDHLEALVRKAKPSGAGHTLNNLLPACRDCNSRRGNKPWAAWMTTEGFPPERVRIVRTYIRKFQPPAGRPAGHAFRRKEKQRLRKIEADIIALLDEANGIIRDVRTRAESNR